MVQCGHGCEEVDRNFSPRMVQMKAHAQRMARLQLIAGMLEGQSWQQAMANADLSIGRSPAYRLVHFALDPERGPHPFPAHSPAPPPNLTHPTSPSFL